MSYVKLLGMRMRPTDKVCKNIFDDTCTNLVFLAHAVTVLLCYTKNSSRSHTVRYVRQPLYDVRVMCREYFKLH